MENIIHQFDKWFLRNRPTSEYEFQNALDIQNSHQTWIDSLLTVSLISEIELHLQRGISEDLVYEMPSLTSKDFLTHVELDVQLVGNYGRQLLTQMSEGNE